MNSAPERCLFSSSRWQLTVIWPPSQVSWLLLWLGLEYRRLRLGRLCLGPVRSLILFVSFRGKFSRVAQLYRNMLTICRESWHQLMHNFLEPLSEFLSTTLFRIPKGTLISRYTRLTFAFGISGMLHTSMEMQLGIHSLKSGAMRFFLMQAGGIMIEDAIQELFRLRGGKSNGCTRTIGHIWTALFVVWTTPSWSWASIRVLIPRGDSSVPFSFAKYSAGEI
jgi:hypothetical protein